MSSKKYLPNICLINDLYVEYPKNSQISTMRKNGQNIYVDTLPKKKYVTIT